MKRSNTNPRYKHFYQTYFTAGDEEQFEETRTHLDVNNTDVSDIRASTIPFCIWDGYANDAVLKTFRYMFNKFKKGIFISIRDNTIATFLPFSKAKFVNEWSNRICVDPKFGSIAEFIKHVCQMENRPFDHGRVNKFVNHWYGNNCLVRYEFPLSENDTGVHHIKSMFEELVQHERVPDIDFFVNRRDFPLLKRDKTEPYNHMWDSEDVPLVSHNYESYTPILSSTTTSKFADIAIPTLEDWARVKFVEGIKFPKTDTRDYSIPEPVTMQEWSLKKNIAVFRGGSTGAGTTIDTNPRLKVASMMRGNEAFIDAGITDWNLRPRKYQGEKYLKTIEINTLPFGLVGKLSPTQQAQYKYIIHIDGHVSAFRLSLELALGCVILKVDSDYKLWYADALVPFVHYIPVKRDLSDLIDVVKWCRENDDKCFEIAKNARAFYDSHLCKQSILTHMKTVLCRLREKMGVVEARANPIDEQYEFELKELTRLPLKVDNTTLIASTKLSKIYTDDAKTVVVKETSDSKKTKENVHEAYIGTRALLYERESNPNFMKVLGIDDKSSTISEFVEGPTMLAWINSNDFSLQKFVKFLFQIALGLQQAQLACGFVHNDLFPWNIILCENRRGKHSYIVAENAVVHIETECVPVFIDYGKSHVVYKGRHFGFINMGVFNPIIDVLSILFSGLACAIKHHRFTREDDDVLVYLLNFISRTEFYPGRFSNFREVRQYVFDNASFSHLITLDVKDLKDRTPFDFCTYILLKFPLLASIKREIHIPDGKKKKLTTKNLQLIKEKIFKNRIYVYYFFQRLSFSHVCSNELVELFKEKIACSEFLPENVPKKILYSTSMYSGIFEIVA